MYDGARGTLPRSSTALSWDRSHWPAWLCSPRTPGPWLQAGGATPYQGCDETRERPCGSTPLRAVATGANGYAPRGPGVQGYKHVARLTTVIAEPGPEVHSSTAPEGCRHWPHKLCIPRTRCPRLQACEGGFNAVADSKARLCSPRTRVQGYKPA